MRLHLMIAAAVLAVLAMPLEAQSQGVIRGAEEGAAAGNRAAGPVGGAVGSVVGGVVGGIKGVLGVPQRIGSADRRDRRGSRERDRWDRAELSANQINDQFAARTARIKADLRLTPEQEKDWPAFETAVKDIGKRNADLQIAMRADRAQLKGPFDVLQQMREEARFLGGRSIDQKALADAAEPLYASLNDQQKQRLAREVHGLGHWPEGY